ncbi:MAG: UDP-N-acetyl-D-mannosaminuronic acid dehydrogenase [Verrucomicrobia bacterium GWF2_51_19]|nr:MAG: UDP-N-acetyl-D-mannosaminuronic acid dehydrogenase [Verrucomicrobia bacterium GWF2_51_19]HCJ11991.1 UDP-N-acetyl-D-mannosamine dehydrogenase [Opitutae bacterium]
MHLDNTKTIVIIGLGYIGLPTAAVFASHGVKVIGVDVNPNTVSTINSGNAHIVEPDLNGLVYGVTHEGLLKAQTKPAEGDAFIIAVPTPFKGDHQPDLSYVRAAVESIAPFLRQGNVVILESTSPVGTVDEMASWLEKARPDLKCKGDDSDIHLAYCPERVLPGHILKELVENDRIIGGLTPIASEKAAELYRIFVQGECILTDARTAEMSKLTENAFRDVNIAFANELSLICDKLDIDIWELIRLANRHPRVKILQPGPGVGGHCIAVDPWFIVNKTPEEAQLIRTAREVNNRKPHVVLEKILQAAADVHSPTIACFGLAFKPDIDDLRESPAVEIVEQLARHKVKVCVVEPYIDTLPMALTAYKNVRLTDCETALNETDVVVMFVKHRAFTEIDRSQLSQRILDVCGVWQ